LKFALKSFFAANLNPKPSARNSVIFIDYDHITNLAIYFLNTVLYFGRSHQGII